MYVIEIYILYYIHVKIICPTFSSETTTCKIGLPIGIVSTFRHFI